VAAFTVVGAPVARAEGPDKVTGRSIYAADVDLPGLLWGKILRSPYPHARIGRIEVQVDDIFETHAWLCLYASVFPHGFYVARE